MSVPSVVFVCTGNICRSVTAERVLEEHLRSTGTEAVVDSAGISDEEEGNPIDPRQARVLAAAGYRTDDHAARRITLDWLAGRDLAIAMTARHFRALERLIAQLPAEDRPELRMLREFDPEVNNPEVNDPEVNDSDSAVSGSNPPATRPAPEVGGRRHGTANHLGEGRIPAPDVPDPWYGGQLKDFEETLETMERSVPGITDHLHSLAVDTR